MYCVFYIGLKYWSVSYAFLAALLAAILPRDIISSTAVGVLAFANMFAALGMVFILTSKKDWQYILGGCFLGISIYSHISYIFFTGLVAFLMWGHKWPELQWKRGSIILVSALLTFMLLNFVSFYLLTGDPFYQYKLLSNLFIRRHPTSYHPDLERLVWPIRNFIVSKFFGVMLSLPVILTFLSWKKQSDKVRFLCLLIFLTWIWMSYGTRTPFTYRPFGPRVRYWYPVALPVCLLSAQVFLDIRRRILRIGYLILMLALPLAALTTGGPWGQNIEITKELMAYASKHPDTTFVTDSYTLNEMYILNGAKPPNNIFSIKNFDQPGPFNIPEKYQQDPNNRKIMFMYNELNMWRPFAAEFKEYVANNVQLSEISNRKYRILSYCLPKFIRLKFRWLVRKPPAKVGKVVTTGL